MKPKEYLTLQKLEQVACGTALSNGLTKPSRKALEKLFAEKSRFSLPLILQNRKGTLWVDKYYIAYQIGSGDVVYTYVSRSHVFEELTSYREAAKLRGQNVKIPSDVHRSLISALRKMQAKGYEYWIASPWVEDDGKDFPKREVSA